jgi:ATP-dependent Zn protease
MSDAYHTAIHEAGHAVIGRVLGIPCGSVTIVPDEADRSAGHALNGTPYQTWEHWLDERGRHREMAVAYRAHIRMLMAGAEAENVILGAGQGGDGYDQHEIALMAENLIDTTSDAWLRLAARLQGQTVQLVRKHRDKIQRVADALVERRTLSGAEIDALMR